MKWEMRPVAELCEFAIDCVNKTAPVVEYETPYKMIRTTNVKGGYIFLDTVRYVTQDVFEKWTRRSKPQYGDVILSREAPVGEVGRFTSNDEFVFLGQRLFHYRANPKLLDWNFLAYVLQSHDVQGRLRGMGFGATVQHITVPDATNLEIPCPPLDIQRRIGGILSAYDDLIENNQRRMKLLEESARMLYQEWFVRLRFPGHEHAKIVDGVPEGWCRTSIDEVTAFLGRGISPAYDEAGKSMVINQKCIRDRRLDLGPARRQSKEFKPERQIQVGDVLVNSTGEGTLGRVSQVFVPIPECTVDSHVTIVRPKAEISRYVFGQMMMSLDAVFPTMGRGATNQKELGRDQIGEMTFFLPSSKVSTEFDSFAEPLYLNVCRLQEQNQKLRAARDLLLPRLMNGEIEV